MRMLVSLVAMVFGLAGLFHGVASAQEGAGAVYVVPARGIVNPTLAGFVIRAIEDAQRDGAAAVVIELDTPGGLDTSMRQIIQKILASDVPVIVYVAPPGGRAASAGVFITYSAHLAAMAHNTNIGSATPVAMGEGGETRMSEEMRNKVTNDAAAYIRSLAERRGRNPEWAERAVREAVNVTEQEALREGIINFIASDLRDLLRQADGARVQTPAGQVTLAVAGAPIRWVDMNWVEAFLHAISDPTIAYILLSVGTMGLFFELSNPGSILPGVVGGICLLLGFYALGTLPVNYAGLLLMGFALLLFAVDLFAPSHGILTLGGIAAFVLGSLLLFNRPDVAPWLAVSLWAVGGVALVFAAYFGVVVGAVARSHRKPALTGREGLIGKVGRVRAPLEPEGLIFVDGALWDAESESGSLPVGTRVTVVAVDGLKLRVRPADSTASQAATRPESPRDAIGDSGLDEGRRMLSSTESPRASEEPAR